MKHGVTRIHDCPHGRYRSLIVNEPAEATTIPPEHETMTDASPGRGLRVVRHLDERAWRRFVDEHPRGNIFHTPEMYRVHQRARGHHPDVWAVVNGTSKILALVVPVHVTLKGGPLGRLTTRSVAYGSALTRDDDEGRDALALLLASYEDAIAGRSLFTEFRNLHDVSRLRPVFEAAGYEYREYLDYLIDLDRSPEDVLKGMRTKTGKAIRRGVRAGHVDVTEVSDPCELADWYGLLRRTYRHSGVPLADRSLFDAAFDILRPARMATFLLARVEGVPAACSVELPYKDTMFGWYGGSDRAFSRFIPNEMLMWHVLESGALGDTRLYDFGGAGSPDVEYGVRDFKAKFGGELVSYGRFVRVHAPVRLRASTVAYSVYQRVERSLAHGR